jgi:AcrR family transcriptional regulator
VRNKDRAAWLREVVAVATKLFLEKGYDATSMEEVAAALGVSKPTIYEAFSSKQHLLEAVAEHAIRDYDVSWLEAAAREALPFADFIDRIAERFWSRMAAAPSTAIFQLLLREGPRAPVLIEAFNRGMRAPGGGVMRDIISSAMARGECRAMAPEAVYHMLLAPGMYLVLQRVLFGEQGVSGKLAADYLDASRRALKESLLLRPGR